MSDEIPHPLSSDDRDLFDAFETTNFEQVLSSLKTAAIVADALGLDDDDVLEVRYESIQRALFEAVHAVHVQWETVGQYTIPRLYEILRDYTYVYSTNYDLLLYWASMEKGGDGFLDYFWGDDNTFAVFDTEIWATRELWTRILFIHGGIHLRRIRSGGTRQLVAANGPILDQFMARWSVDESPLLVSEGESGDKLASILSSDYLRFAHQMFATHEGGLVIFGHSLGEQDDHLVIPLRSWRENPIAVSLRPSDNEDEIVQKKDRIRGRLSPMKDVVFFDSTTHPLGDPTLAAHTD